MKDISSSRKRERICKEKIPLIVLFLHKSDARNIILVDFEKKCISSVGPFKIENQVVLFVQKKKKNRKIVLTIGKRLLA